MADTSGELTRPGGIVDGEALAPHTTLGLGGPARHFAVATDVGMIEDALRWADACGLASTILGGGSNVVVADGGVDGLVLHMGIRGRSVRRVGDRVSVTAAAGEPWDELVAWTAAEGWAGLECLSGIPGSVGAVPVQNVGAYGQEVAGVIDGVRVLDRSCLSELELAPEHCSFGYRRSRFRDEPHRFVVLAVRFALRRGGAATLAYPELLRRFGAATASPRLEEVREAVLELRRSKSMVVEAADPNRRSVGSFFVNPVVSEAAARAVVARAIAGGAATCADEVPRYPQPGGGVKLSAAWLVERAGFARGTRRGAVGVSDRHCLALVHHGGGTTAALLELAAEIIAAVEGRFAVRLRPEPVFLGFDEAGPWPREARG